MNTPSTSTNTDTSTIDVEQRAGTRLIWLNRPKVRNALDAATIAALGCAIGAAVDDPQTRVLVLAARGPVFCAGADLNWMRRSAQLTQDENQADAGQLAQLLYVIHSCPKPVVARVQGDCYGGGIGLVAACDIAVATPQTQWCFSEVRLGLVPATIAPYVLRAMSARAASHYWLTGERFAGSEARALGLVQHLSAAAELDAFVERLTDHLMLGGPDAIVQVKRLIDTVTGRPVDESLAVQTAGIMARVRASDEAREGMQAFFQHRRAAWTGCSTKS